MGAIVVAAAGVLGGMVALWLLSLKLNDVSIVDVFWGAGFIVAAWLCWWQTGMPMRPAALLALGCVTIWGSRLALHIGSRNLGHGEDERYRQWREAVGSSFAWKSLYKVFLFQGLLLLLICAPVFANLLADEPGRVLWAPAIGAIVWFVGLLFEAIGDWQLRRFKADPANRGKVMDRGLWRYTRHPNYFGDALVWWGLAIMALDLPYGWIYLLSPLLMTYFLLRVTGVPLLEQHMRETKPGYAAYAARTSGFLPLPPREVASHEVHES